MAQGKSLKDWIELYEAKVKEKAELPSGFSLVYLADRGFTILKPDTESKMMVIYQVCGDGKFWRDYAELKALELGLEVLGSICVRRFAPYIRAFGWELLDTECYINNDETHHRYLCQDSTGRAVLFSHKGFDEDTGEPQYWVTQYLNRKAAPTIKEFLKEKGELLDV